MKVIKNNNSIIHLKQQSRISAQSMAYLGVASIDQKNTAVEFFAGEIISSSL